VIVVLCVLAAIVPWPDLTSATPSSPTTRTTAPDLSPVINQPPEEPVDVDELRERIAALDAQLQELQGAREDRKALIAIRKNHSRAFEGFNFDEEDKAFSKLDSMIGEFRKYPLTKDEEALLDDSQSAAKNEFSATFDVYDPLLELAEKLSERHRVVNQELEELRRVITDHTAESPTDE
jgi:hypothetical protein